MRKEKEGGAWCPKGQVSPESRQHLTVDLGAVHVVAAVGTQGRFGNGKGQEYTEAYMLEYWRPGLDSFTLYSSGYGNHVRGSERE